MKITLNGQEKELAKTRDLKGLVDQFCKSTIHIIAEVNGEIIKNPQWGQTIIRDGDTVELINFVGGG